MWFGTQDGLNRYDGTNFKIYRRMEADPHSISSVYITALCLDSQNRLWVGTRGGGLNRYDYSLDGFDRFQHEPGSPGSLCHDEIQAICEDRKGFIWIGTLNGMSVLPPGSRDFVQYKHEPGSPGTLPDNEILAVFEDHKGDTWVGTGKGGLARRERNKHQFVTYREEPGNPYSLSGNRVTCIYEDSRKKLWIGTESAGLNRFDRETGRFFHYRGNRQGRCDLNNETVLSILEDSRGVLWVGTEIGGLNRLDHETGCFDHYVHDPANSNSLIGNTINAIYEDRSGTLWFGTWDGVSQFNRTIEQFEHYKYDANDPDGLISNDIMTLYQDREGYIWICSKGGLNRFRYETGKFNRYLHQPGEKDCIGYKNIYSITEDHRGEMWIGTGGGGLDRLDKTRKRFSHYVNEPGNPRSLGHNVIMYLLEDRSHRLWIATRGGGLNILDKERRFFTRYEYDPDNPRTIGHKNIFTIFEDRSGAVWIGTWGGGLCRFNRETRDFTRFVHQPGNRDSICHNDVLCIYEVEEEAGEILWFATGGGLDKYEHKTGRFSHYTIKDGLPSNNLYGMLEDDDGNFWLSSNNGLSRFNRQTGEIKNYSKQHGLQSNEFNSWAFVKLRNRRMMFGGINGFNVFVPSEIKDNTHIPPVVITDFRLFNKSVPIGGPGGVKGSRYLEKSIIETGGLELSYRDRVFSFEFAALDFVAPGKNQYAYMMEGFEQQWNDVGNRRFATYTNLPAGEYRFRVRGSNNDGVWNMQGASIKIKIIPPFWRKPWFIGLTVLILIGLIYGVYRYRLALLGYRTKLLEAKVNERTADLTHEIGVRKQIEKELKKAKEASEEANQAKTRFLANMSHEIRTPMNAIIGFASIMAGEIKDKKHKDYARAISSSGNRLLRLINDILDLSRIEAGKLELEYEPLDTRLMLEEIKQIFSHRVNEKGLEFHLVIDPGFPRALLLDGLRLHQVLFNLVGNAVKFTHKGSVTLSAILRSRQCENRGSEPGTVDVEFAVKDSGIGIPGDQLESIFEEFKQQDGQSMGKYGGTGLGLAITRRLVRMMGGKIWAESEKVNGSTFRVVLENIRVGDLPDESLMDFQLNVDSIRFDEATVLVADDRELNRKLLIEYLSGSPIRFLEAETGNEALEITREHRPDLVLMDLKMPGMDGGDACKLIKNDEELKHTPVMIITASALKEQRQWIEETGCDGFLDKPVSKVALVIETTRFLSYSEAEPHNEEPGEAEPGTGGSEVKQTELERANLIKTLKSETLNQRYREICRTFILNEVEEFSTEMKELGQSFHSILLCRWADRMSGDLNTFNLPRIRATFEEFPGLIEEIAG